MWIITTDGNPATWNPRFAFASQEKMEKIPETDRRQLSRKGQCGPDQVDADFQIGTGSALLQTKVEEPHPWALEMLLPKRKSGG